jgi:D-aspartate ligase
VPDSTSKSAVVVDVSWVNGLATLRSLGRRGLRVFAIDHRPSALGLRSRYAQPVLAPEPVADEEGFIQALRDLGKELRGPTPLFPTHDEHLNAIARHAGDLEDHYLFPFPDWKLLEDLQSKRRQLEKAEQEGIAVPRTVHPASGAEARAAAKELGFPVLVKPSDNVVFKQLYKRQAFLCETPAELDEAYGLAEPFHPMVQELIPGEIDALWTLGSYIGADGAPLGLFSGRKLKQTRGWTGHCRVGEAAWNEEVVATGLRLLRAFDFHGISQVEFKRDARDGQLKLMEINPRLWQWHGLAAACGVDLPWIAYRDLTGDRLPPARMVGQGKHWAISFVAGSPPGVQLPPYVDAVFARDDMRPAVVQLVRVAKNAVRRGKGPGPGRERPASANA